MNVAAMRNGIRAARQLIAAGRWMMLAGGLLIGPLCWVSLSLWAVAAIPLLCGFTLYGTGRLGLIELTAIGKNDGAAMALPPCAGPENRP